MGTPASSGHAKGGVPSSCSAYVIKAAEKPSTDGPNIKLGSLSPAPRVSRAEIALLNAPGRTNLMEQFGRQSELPQDVIDALTQEPRFNADRSAVLAAVLTPPATFDIPPVDLQSLIVLKEQTGGGTAVQMEQDQQDCCNCCNLQ